MDDTAGAVTAAHVAFFRRYGYVVVERVLPAELVARVAGEVKAHLLKRHGVDLSDLRGSLSAARMQRAFSPDGSGMIELYWLAAMEEASLPPTTHPCHTTCTRIFVQCRRSSPQRKDGTPFTHSCTSIHRT